MKKVFLIVLILTFWGSNLFAFSVEEFDFIVNSIGKSKKTIQQETKNRDIVLEKEGTSYGNSFYGEEKGEHKDITAIAFHFTQEKVSSAFCQFAGQKGIVSKQVVLLLMFKENEGEIEHIKTVQNEETLIGKCSTNILKTKTGIFIQVGIVQGSKEDVVAIKVNTTGEF